MSEEIDWGWREVAIAVALLLPALLFGSILALVVGWAIQGSSPDLVQVAIPGQFAGYGLWLAGVWLVFRSRESPFWERLGWRWPAGGPWIYLALGPALALLTGLLAGLLKAKNISSGLMEQLLSDPVACKQLVLFGVTGAPLIEELLFRGIALPVAVRSMGVAGGLLVTSVPFALMHGPMYEWSWQHLTLLVVVSLAFGAVRLRSGSTLASTVTHGAYNLMMFAGHFLTTN